MRNSEKNTIAIAVSLASFCAPQFVQANEAMVLEEVVVTAQKRSQSLQQVPLAVQALSGDTLAQNGVSTLSDLSSISPGFKLADTQGTSNISALRGVNSFAFGFGLEESIPFYLDGVYLGNGFDMLGDLLDIQRVEVLKGPQGTLFGRNASGGAISIVRNRPANEFEAELGTGLGNYGLLTSRGVVNVPVIDDVLMVRGGFSTRDRDGWQTNVITANEDGLAQDRMSGFVRALWIANHALEIEYAGDWTQQKDHPGYRSVSSVRPGSTTFTGLWDQANPASFYDQRSENNASGDRGMTLSLGGGSLVIPVIPAATPPDAIQNREIAGNALTLTWDMNEYLTLTSISSYRKVDTKVGTDADGGDLGLANTWELGTTREFNQELRINAAWESVDWLAGFNYYQQDRDMDITTHVSSLVALQRIGLDGREMRITESSAGQNETESYSVFADATWHVSDRLNLTAGIRYSHDEKEYSLIDAGNDSFNDQGILYPNFDQLADPSTTSWANDWSNVSGRVGFDYGYSDNVMLYGSVSQGYKSGGFNTRLTVEGSAADGYFSPDFGTEPFDEETNINYELGFKSDVFDGRLRFNSSIFYYLYEDLQVLLADGNSPVGRTVNASEVTGYGWDSELTYLAANALTLSLNVLALNAEYTDDVLDTTGVLRIESGSTRPWAPDWATTMAVDYAIDLHDLGELRANITYAYQTEQFMRNTQVNQSYTDADHIQDAYGLLNGRVSLYSANRHWELAFWGKNILDEEYKGNLVAASDSVAGVLLAVRGEPRTYGVEAIYRF
ncbi:TonB-dependent receptor [Parahaliea mediterranea]|uniref:TonB-dependent receptor n=1 Tax=Parahaliea mediterranea TaxID=651086 RepID=A0A939DGD0_9GAMM|nr:TonB-dependent receptor [Parahaliea mediterranea]MBN7797605.1 TonB-dependent receptor [Parahaliea mediterranea]